MYLSLSKAAVLSAALLIGTAYAETEVAASTEVAAVVSEAADAVETMEMAVDVAPVSTEAEAVAEAEAAPAEAAPVADSGDTAWIIVATALVLLMTLPGLALFYAGMVRRKNVLGTLMHSFGAAAAASIAWVVLGYSLAFGEGSGAMGAFIGDFKHVFLANIDINALSGTIPVSLFVLFQMTFAIITVAILSGSFAERVKFSSFMLFSALWVLVVYSPITHWVWQANGWLFKAGALDFAGGTVVHINAGVAGLVAAYILGKRIGYGKESMAPHNLVLTLIGGALLWVGWFGFNAGSALTAGSRASMAMLVTHIAAAVAACSWMACEWATRGKSSLLGGVSGAIAGLVVITPAAGFVDPTGALIMGAIGGAVCFVAVMYCKKLLRVDDSLDAFGLHAVGGIVGALLTAVFVTKAVTGTDPLPVMQQLWIQTEGILATIAYSAVMTAVLVLAIDKTIGLRLSQDNEREGMDLSQHGEKVE